jgi:SAM-dependent methyltransferase
MTDTEAVARLEALVHAQRPASEPWAPVTDYSFEARREVEGLHPQLIKDIFQPSSVIDVGCGPEAVLVRLLDELGVTVLGIDAQPSPYPQTIQLDIAKPWPYGSHRVDLVICREMLEHCTIRQVVRAVRNIVALAGKYIYVTTRFAAEPDHLLDVDTADDLDPTHITMLSKDFLRTLFVLEGCRSRPDLEARLDWQQKGRCLVFEV